MSNRRPLRELATLFLRLGVIGFGGPAAHIALMRREFVVQRQWVSDAEFMEMVGVTNLIPGPNSTEMAMHLGSRRAGWRGLIVSGLSFIVPAALIVGALAWAYERYDTNPLVFDLRYGILPVIIAIVAHALVGLSRSTLLAPVPAALAVSAAVTYLMGVNELVVLGLGGAVGAVAHLAPKWVRGGRVGALGALGLTGAAASQPEMLRIWWQFLRIGALVYGSGYVLLAFLERDLVQRYGWVSPEQLLDAVAVGQITRPGVLHGHLPRLAAPRSRGCCRGHGSDLRPLVRVRGRSCAGAAPAAPLPRCEGGGRRRHLVLTRADGRCPRPSR